MEKTKIALITGATAGIGEATAEIFAKNGINLILCGRNESKLEINQKKLSEYVKVTTLKFDVSDKNEVFNAIDSLSEEWKKIDILVNNAGNAYGLDPFDEAKLEDFESMIDINVKGVLYVSKAIVPLLKKSKNAHIINLSSIAGKETYLKGSVYCASKSAIEAISKGMRMDLVSYGIKVTNVAPGAVETDFSLVRFKGDKAKADAVYAGFEPLIAKDIANTIWFAVSQPDHVQIADITIFPKAQASSTVFNKKL